jgi:hypothetical protein
MIGINKAKKRFSTGEIPQRKSSGKSKIKSFIQGRRTFEI